MRVCVCTIFPRSEYEHAVNTGLCTRVERVIIHRQRSAAAAAAGHYVLEQWRDSFFFFSFVRVGWKMLRVAGGLK